MQVDLKGSVRARTLCYASWAELSDPDAELGGKGHEAVGQLGGKGQTGGAGFSPSHIDPPRDPRNPQPSDGEGKMWAAAAPAASPVKAGDMDLVRTWMMMGKGRGRGRSVKSEEGKGAEGHAMPLSRPPSPPSHLNAARAPLDGQAEVEDYVPPMV